MIIRTDDLIHFEIAQQKAFETLINYSDGILPIDPFSIINKIQNIKLYTYDELAKTIAMENPDLEIERIRKNFGSDRGFLKMKNGKFILAYNERDPICVIRWTLFHELGHYFLEHLHEDNTMLGLSEKECESIHEKEANCFARHCSSPLPIVSFFIFKTGGVEFETSSLFMYLFNMGYEATNNCINHWYNYGNYYHFSDYLKLVARFEDDLKVKIQKFDFDFMPIYLDKINKNVFVCTK